MTIRYVFFCLTVYLLALSNIGFGQSVFSPGTVYKEFSISTFQGDNWRVTEPEATQSGASAFLPNPVLNIDIDDLENATRAEVVLDHWGGHAGTSKKRIRFNGNAWLDVPGPLNTSGDPNCYMYQSNPLIEIPLSELKEGSNRFEGTAGNQTCYSFGWGQWGWYAVVVRVYYDAELKTYSTGHIESPKTGDILNENPILVVNVSNGENRDDIERVEFFGYYDGYDENGDGLYEDWHYAYRGSQDRRVQISSHIGEQRSGEERYSAEWLTKWIPDQSQSELKIVARIKNKNGYYFVTDIVENLNLAREAVFVKIYKPSAVPEDFWVRAGQRKGCDIAIPSSDNLGDMLQAGMNMATWNGLNHGASTRVRVNNWNGTFSGKDHFHDYKINDIDPSILKSGINRFSVSSASAAHGVEIMWPGPAISAIFRNFPPEISRIRNQYVLSSDVSSFVIHTSDLETPVGVRIEVRSQDEVAIPNDRVGYTKNGEGTWRIQINPSDLKNSQTELLIESFDLGGASSIQPVTIVVEEDNDGDKLSDLWELQYWDTLENSKGPEDSDFDGYTDLEEFVYGSVPIDGSNYPQLLINEVEGGYALSMTTLPFRFYSLWKSTNLIDWTLIDSIEGTGENWETFDSANGEERYYRAEANFNVTVTDDS